MSLQSIFAVGAMMTKMRVFGAGIVVAITVAGAVSSPAMARLTLTPPTRMAQATPPLQSTPGAEQKPSAPSDTSTTGQRPHETPPQPARPDTDAQNTGARPALPPAPAEKTAPPVQSK